MSLSPRDLLFAAVGLLLVVGLLAAAFRLRTRLRSLLTDREWRLLFEVVAIVLLGALLVFTDIAVELPAELFIYGRF